MQIGHAPYMQIRLFYFALKYDQVKQDQQTKNDSNRDSANKLKRNLKNSIIEYFNKYNQKYDEACRNNQIN